MGERCCNYTITNQSSTTANITAAPLTATASANNKVYDGTTTASVTLTFSGLVGDETLGQSVGATFADQNVASGTTVTVNTITLSDDGGLASNYSIATGQTTTADITAAPLTATASANNKVYDGTTTASVTLTFSGLVGDETLGQSVGATFADQNVASGTTVTVNTITLSDDGGLASNYSIATGQTTTADITAAPLTATASANNKVYDGTTTASVTLTFSGLVGDETLGQSVGATFADQNVASGTTVTVNTITLSDDGGLASNYSIATGQTTTADITAAPLTATASANNKVYDGTTTASVTLTFSGLVGDETLGQSVGATFADQNVASGTTVTVNTITLSDDGGLASNYSIATGQTTTANITQLSSVTWNGNAGDGLWSSASNWAGSAIPDQNNVAAVVIPSAQNVTFDSDTVGTIGSTITNNGTLTFNGATDYTFGQVISGSGALVKTNTNTLTLNATNTYSR